MPICLRLRREKQTSRQSLIHTNIIPPPTQTERQLAHIGLTPISFSYLALSLSALSRPTSSSPVSIGIDIRLFLGLIISVEDSLVFSSRYRSSSLRSSFIRLSNCSSYLPYCSSCIRSFLIL